MSKMTIIKDSKRFVVENTREHLVPRPWAFRVPGHSENYPGATNSYKLTRMDTFDFRAMLFKTNDVVS